MIATEKAIYLGSSAEGFLRHHGSVEGALLDAFGIRVLKIPFQRGYF